MNSKKDKFDIKVEESKTLNNHEQLSTYSKSTIKDLFNNFNNTSCLNNHHINI